MEKNIKKIIIVVSSFILTLLTTTGTFANNSVNSLKPVEYSDEFKQWIELSEEEKQNAFMPRMYDIQYSKIKYKNPLYLTRMVGSSGSTDYSLMETIPENIKIKNQQQTNSCWAFSTLSSLETNLALEDEKNDILKEYDFSERHMEYATSYIFKDGVTNPIGYYRTAGVGGQWFLAQSYLTNGMGAINETEMRFENNENIINIEAIQGKTVTSQVYDTTVFLNYNDPDFTAAERIEIKNQIKNHIKNYGSVYASVHADILGDCYDNGTGAQYCNNSSTHLMNHAISIIGWDDNFSFEDIPLANKPSSKGAWIIRNSWGEKQPYNLADVRSAVFTENKDIEGWTSEADVTDEYIEDLGFDIEGDMAYMPIGDNGIMYVSYEDCNITQTLFGIVKATNVVAYDNIYQYDIFYPMNYAIYENNSTAMLGTIFEKENTQTEYLTQISVFTPQIYNCKVYVNPSSNSLAKEDLTLVELKAGESETISVGYHTIEFAEPVELTGNEFAVILEISVEDDDVGIMLESNFGVTDQTNMLSYFNNVTIETDKCFATVGNDLDNANWESTSSFGDTTIKAFTTNELIDESLKYIEITTPPEKTEYIEGENFDPTNMVVTAYYNSKIKPSVILDISDYSITGGTNLQEGQTSVTITYEGKSVEQAITVEKNSVTELTIITPPGKTEYKEGQNFDITEMVIEATRKDGSKEIVTEYRIENGNNLRADQTSVIISYEGKTIEQEITVVPNPLVEIKVEQEPDKTNYVAGQNFDEKGMIVLGVYEDGTTLEILNYTIENGTNLTKEQTSVTISYLDKTTTQDITVVEKTITSIAINTKPNKLTYIQNNENLDLTGGIITVTYNDKTTENIDMTSEEVIVSGFDNKNEGKIILTVEYQSKILELEVEIIKPIIEKIDNSDLDNAKCDVKEVKSYSFTNNSQEDYTLIEVEINNIKRNLNNDKVEYYYYLSTIKDEEGITEWTKITEEQVDSDKLKFTINSKDLSNYEEISKENVLYLYIKEVVTKGVDQGVKISKAISVEANAETKLEIYVDNIKTNNTDINNGLNNNNNNNNDTTIAGSELPNTGNTTIIIIALSLITISIICYFKYHKLKDIK